MREIKFNFYNTKTKKYTRWEESNAGMLMCSFSTHEHLIFLQFTGLKDKNGKEIYEGDIVKYTFRDGGRFNTRYMEITYRDAGFKMIEIYRDYWLEKVDGKLTLKHGYLVDYKGELSNLHPSNLVYWTEVIGNVYENPELLESKHE